MATVVSLEVIKEGKSKQHRGNAATMIDFVSRHAELWNDVLAKGTLTFHFSGLDQSVKITPALEMAGESKA